MGKKAYHIILVVILLQCAAILYILFTLAAQSKQGKTEKTLTYLSSPSAMPTASSTPDLMKTSYFEMNNAISTLENRIIQKETLVSSEGNRTFQGVEATLAALQNSNAVQEKILLTVVEEQSFVSQTEEAVHNLASGTKIHLDEHELQMDDFEVTNRNYQECVSIGACTPLAVNSEYSLLEKYDDYPVVNISFAQASAYCQSKGKRLPTLKEWRIFARETMAKINRPSILTINANSESDSPMAVNRINPVAFSTGPYHLLGNVWEWVLPNDPNEPSAGEMIVGGSWKTSYDDLGIDCVGTVKLGEGADDVGFRCIMEN